MILGPNNGAPAPRRILALFNHTFFSPRYVLAAKDDTYALIYYCGCNDATCGYSGAVLYTRVSSWKELDATSQAEVGAALDKAGVKGLSMNAMCTTDNRSCE